MDLGFTVSPTAPNPPYERLDKVMAGKEPSARPSTSAFVGIAVVVLLIVTVIALVVAKCRLVSRE
ncbi:MAG: hypothetical protein JWP48_879 [Actinoallomurus sp.]|jgi:hypothetical protein|nr:hypothetical protein [Actinoallomurus sp.]